MTEQEKAILKEFIDLAGDAAKAPMLMAAEIEKLRDELNRCPNESWQCAKEHRRLQAELLAAQKQVLGLRDALCLIESNPSTSAMTKIFCRQALSSDPAPDLDFVAKLVSAIEDIRYSGLSQGFAGDQTSIEECLDRHHSIASDVLAATKVDRESWGLK